MRWRIFVCLCAAVLLETAPAQQRTPAKPRAIANCEPLNGQLLKCPKFGFSYKVPFGWVDRTTEMQSSAIEASGRANEDSSEATAPNQSGEATSSAGSETLLAVFERPPDAPGETINSAVIIVAESRAKYPQVKTAADYFGPIGDLAERGGLKPVNDPYGFSSGSKRLVREDFSGEHGKLTMYQSSLVMITKGEIVSFTFVGGSEDEVDDLIAQLGFVAGGRSTSTSKP